MTTFNNPPTGAKHGAPGSAGKRYSEEDRREMCQLYRKGSFINAIAKTFGCSTATVHKALLRNGVPTRAQGGAWVVPWLNKNKEKDICQSYLKGNSQRTVAKAFGCSSHTVMSVLKRNGVTARHKNISKENQKKICQSYLEGNGLNKVGEDFGYSGGAIWHVLKRNGVTARTGFNGKRGCSEAQGKEMCQSYVEGNSMKTVAKAFGFSQPTVQRVLMLNGVPARDCKYVWNEADEKEICRLYLLGESTYAIGEKYSAVPGTITKLLRTNGIAIRRNVERKGGPTKDQEKEICNRYLNGTGIPLIAKAFNFRGATIKTALMRNGVKVLSFKLAHGGLTDEQERDLCRQYDQGASPLKLSKIFPIGSATAWNIAKRNGCKMRSQSEAQQIFDKETQQIICKRYQEGLTAGHIASDFGVTNTCILSVLARNNVERRDSTTGRDSVQHAIEASNHFANNRECQFYLCELTNYSSTHCKPGIAFNLKTRIDEEYGDEYLSLFFSTRTEAYFLEQAVLDATRDCAEAPPELYAWVGSSEVRSMPAADLEPIVLHFANEMEDLGIWEFAARYVPMTSAQRATCRLNAQKLL